MSSSIWTMFHRDFRGHPLRKKLRVFKIHKRHISKYLEGGERLSPHAGYDTAEDSR